MTEGDTYYLQDTGYRGMGKLIGLEDWARDEINAVSDRELGYMELNGYVGLNKARGEMI